VPRPVERPLPPAETLRLALASEGVAAPPHGDEDAAQGLLFLAAHLVERQKRISFADFSWDDPRFVAEDDKVRVELPYARLGAEETLRGRLLAEMPRLRGVSCLALDARDSDAKEYQMEHELYGEVTLSSWPHKPAMPKDPRIAAAREAGWGKTLKEHNLLPGRGIVVRDDEQGLLLTEPALARLPGVLLLLRSGEVHLWWNPFCAGLDSEMQYWFQWGDGSAPASGWREVMRVEDE
jgi:hypothetical protein